MLTLEQWAARPSFMRASWAYSMVQHSWWAGRGVPSRMSKAAMELICGGPDRLAEAGWRDEPASEIREVARHVASLPGAQDRIRGFIL